MTKIQQLEEVAMRAKKEERHTRRQLEAARFRYEIAPPDDDDAEREVFLRVSARHKEAFALWWEIRKEIWHVQIMMTCKKTERRQTAVYVFCRQRA